MFSCSVNEPIIVHHFNQTNHSSFCVHYCFCSALEFKAVTSLSKIKQISFFSALNSKRLVRSPELNQTNHVLFTWFIEFATITGCVDAQLLSHLKNIVKRN